MFELRVLSDFPDFNGIINLLYGVYKNIQIFFVYQNYGNQEEKESS